MGRGWIAPVWCARRAMVEFASSVVLTPAGVMKLVNIADLKSAASRLVGSSPIPGTRLSIRDCQILPFLGKSTGCGFFCLSPPPLLLRLLPNFAHCHGEPVCDQVRIALRGHDRFVAQNPADCKEVNAAIDHFGG